MKVNFPIAFAVLFSVFCLPGCRALYEMSPDYQHELARKAYEEQTKKEADAINSMVHSTMTTGEAMRRQSEQYRKMRDDYAREHPDHPGVELPLSASPDAREVHINGRTYTCAGKSTVYCE